MSDPKVRCWRCFGPATLADERCALCGAPNPGGDGRPAKPDNPPPIGEALPDNVTVLPVVTTLDLPVRRTLRAADMAGLKSVVVCGWDDNGVFYFSSSLADGGEVLWLLEGAKMRLLQAGGVIPRKEGDDA